MDTDFTVLVFDDLDKVSADWPVGADAIADVRYHPFQSVTFLKVWLSTFGRSGERSLHFVEVRDGQGRPLLFIPLCIERRSGIRILGFIDGDAADYNAPVLFATKTSWTRTDVERLWQSITAALPPFDLQVLTKMPAGIDGVFNPLSLLGDRPNQVSCHGNDLRRSWAEIDKAVPRRQGLLRKIRKLQGQGPLQFRTAEDDAERLVVTEAFLRQKQWRFEQTRVPGFDADHDKRDFFTDGTAVFARERMLQLFYLQSGDTIIATMWGLTVAKRFYAIMLSFEPGEWARFSPGSILYYRTLQHLHAQGYEWLDLGIGDEAWKVESCETTFDLVATEVAVTVAGRLLLMKNRLLSRARSTAAWQAIRPLKWVIRRRLRRGAQAIPVLFNL